MKTATAASPAMSPHEPEGPNHAHETAHIQPSAIDELAINSIVAQNSDKLRRRAFRILNDEDLAKDVVQHSFEKAWEHRHDYQDSGKLPSWLMTIAQNKARDMVKTPWHTKTDFYGDLGSTDRELEDSTRRGVRLTPAMSSSESDDNQDPAAIYERKELASAVSKAIKEKLTEEQRQVVELSKNGSSYEEIAKELNIPETTVRTRLYRARQQIKKALGSYHAT